MTLDTTTRALPTWDALVGMWPGMLVVLVAAVTLFLLVHRELAPQSGLRGRAEWWLAAGLGMGLVAFVAKMAVVVVVSLAPQWAIGLGAAADAAPPLRAEAPAAVWDHAADASPWRRLPAVAPAPADNPTTPAKVALGERLFHDVRLSANRQVACASCHEVRRGAGTDGRAQSLGIGGQRGTRNAPTVFNAAFQPLLFWDGRATSLEAQAKGPLVNAVEMGMPSLAAVEAVVAEDRDYGEAFAQAFGAGAITIDRIAQAIAAYERTLVTPDTPYDRFLDGDARALSAAQLRGMALFQSVGCIGCHAGANFSGAGVFEAASLWRSFPALPTDAERGYRWRADLGKATPGAAQGLWRIPSLRNVALTPPYLHDGSVQTLDEVVRVMAQAQLGWAVAPAAGAVPESSRQAVWSSAGAQVALPGRPPLQAAEIADLVAFMEALSSDRLRQLQPSQAK